MLKQIIDQLAPYQARLVAVSKTHPHEAIREAYQEGQRDFGENKVQELVEKQASLPDDIRWHFIGHLQSNKVKYIAGFVHLIHAVDSWKLLQEINKRAIQNDRSIDVLLQLKIAEEDSKYGLSKADLIDLLTNKGWQELSHVRITGLMGMATYTDDHTQIRSEFQHLKEAFEDIHSSFFAATGYFSELSMGMSGDYQIALEEGSTLIRIGSLIFGARNYH